MVTYVRVVEWMEIIWMESVLSKQAAAIYGVGGCDVNGRTQMNKITGWRGTYGQHMSRFEDIYANVEVEGEIVNRRHRTERRRGALSARSCWCVGYIQRVQFIGTALLLFICYWYTRGQFVVPTKYVCNFPNPKFWTCSLYVLPKTSKTIHKVFTAFGSHWRGNEWNLFSWM